MRYSNGQGEPFGPDPRKYHTKVLEAPPAQVSSGPPPIKLREVPKPVTGIKARKRSSTTSVKS